MATNAKWDGTHKANQGTPAAQAFERVTEQHLKNSGIAFDFSAGTAPHTYAVQIGAASADTVSGSDARDYLWGRAEDDALAGNRGDDNLFGDAGADLLVGGDGGDRLIGGLGHDTLYGGMDADGLMGGMGDDILDEGDGHGDLNGGAGDDILIGGRGADAFMISADSGNDVIRDFTAGPGMFDHLAIVGLSWSDLTFDDSAEGVHISWDGGSVLLNGVSKAELSQDDFMFANSPELPPSSRPADGPAPERPTPSEEGPAIAGAGASNPAADRIADAMLKRDAAVQLAFSGDEAYTVKVGTSKPDRFIGDDAWDNFFGRDGNDQLSGNGGNDIIQGDAGDDKLDGGDGSDRLDGGSGADQLIGGNEEDEVMG